MTNIDNVNCINKYKRKPRNSDHFCFLPPLDVLGFSPLGESGFFEAFFGAAFWQTLEPISVSRPVSSAGSCTGYKTRHAGLRHWSCQTMMYHLSLGTHACLFFKKDIYIWYAWNTKFYDIINICIYILQYVYIYTNICMKHIDHTVLLFL